MTPQPPNEHPHRQPHQPQGQQPQYPAQYPHYPQPPQYPQYLPQPPMPPQQNWNPTQVQYELRHPARQAFFTSIGKQLGEYVGKHWFWLIFPFAVVACIALGAVANALQVLAR